MCVCVVCVCGVCVCGVCVVCVWCVCGVCVWCVCGVCVVCVWCVVCVCVCVLSHVWLFATPWTIAHHTPLSVKFPNQEYWSGFPFSLSYSRGSSRLRDQTHISVSCIGRQTLHHWATWEDRYPCLYLYYPLIPFLFFCRANHCREAGLSCRHSTVTHVCDETMYTVLTSSLTAKIKISF